MAKPKLRDLIEAKKASLRKATPKSRDRIRHGLNVLMLCQVLRKRGKSAA